MQAKERFLADVRGCNVDTQTAGPKIGRPGSRRSKLRCPSSPKIRRRLQYSLAASCAGRRRVFESDGHRAAQRSGQSFPGGACLERTSRLPAGPRRTKKALMAPGHASSQRFQAKTRDAADLLQRGRELDLVGAFQSRLDAFDDPCPAESFHGDDEGEAEFLPVGLIERAHAGLLRGAASI